MYKIHFYLTSVSMDKIQHLAIQVSSNLLGVIVDLYKVVLTFDSVQWMKSLSVTIQMKATEQYFPVVLFIMLYKVALTSESVSEILKCDRSNESY